MSNTFFKVESRQPIAKHVLKWIFYMIQIHHTIYTEGLEPVNEFPLITVSHERAMIGIK